MQQGFPGVEQIDGLGGFLAREWFGVRTAVGDLDHDGVNDLAVGMPGTPYFDSPPGAVVVFLGPLSTGNYTLDDADLILHDSDEENDHFGYAPAIGDLDGDGFNELVVGSKFAPGGGFERGMVTTYSDLFGPPPR